MNILLATDAGLERGGITLAMLQWIRGIRKAYGACGVTVYFRDGIESREIEREYRELGARVCTGNISRKISFKDPAARGKVLKDIGELLGRERFDVVHVHSGVFGYNADILCEAKRRGVPVRVSHSHGAYPEKWYDKVVHSFLLRRIRSAATVYAGCSRNAGIYLFGKEGVESPKWHWIPNTIRAERFRFDPAARKKYRDAVRASDDELLLGAVGHLNPVKNHDFLLELTAGLKSEGIAAKLLLLGQGAERERLEKSCDEWGVGDRVIFCGAVTDVPLWLSAMDHYLMPSRSEGFPLSAVEAQASGLPCLLSDRIGREVALTDRVCFLPIDRGTGPWIRALKHMRPATEEDREKAADLVKAAGLDEKDTWLYVRELYSA